MIKYVWGDYSIIWRDVISANGQTPFIIIQHDTISTRTCQSTCCKKYLIDASYKSLPLNHSQMTIRVIRISNYYQSKENNFIINYNVAILLTTMFTNSVRNYVIEFLGSEAFFSLSISSIGCIFRGKLISAETPPYLYNTKLENSWLRHAGLDFVHTDLTF